ncbi:ADP-ribosyl cyclase, variant [Capsaspora owczarzaki ATCC 30864]|uniref:ADP-ribosyl cyclase, variant n=1 Tax=Capsaspora owczarzaki (strain ATCC 30864) TaxID=595528 RepID=A0A0D2WPI6_CAPO3|nr:ADP-ribosyl cyclase, variant [Capsaspora owczarzaki ATCC 30864]
MSSSLVVCYGVPASNIGSQYYVHQLSDAGLRYFTMEDTVGGFVQNGLHWCGSSSGYNYTSCPPGFRNTTTDTWYGAELAFWQHASTTFARQATGRVSVLLGSPYGGSAYRNSSFFALYELPNMNTSLVTAIDVYVITNGTERCGSGSLVALVQDIKHHLGLTPSCYDNPDMVRFILCENNGAPSAQCQFANEFSESSDLPADKAVPLALGCLLGGAILVIAVQQILLLRKKQASSQPMRQPLMGYGA